uniref:Uncharacterized protein n=1 Tax=Anguilla anguilla TaxID=7936 RepID=A0A0E9QK17_ANGAN
MGKELVLSPPCHNKQKLHVNDIGSTVALLTKHHVFSEQGHSQELMVKS